MPDALNVASTFTRSYMWNRIFFLSMARRHWRNLSLTTDRVCFSLRSGLTSLRLMMSSERALEPWVRKKSLQVDA
ncbi:hypothetical protein VZT92_010371 [Zoarces viviparus]|uniref:Uncharacterized protein n=1 Tax=Zoarces viviparus TaxID=48416 RepID=A0AAW1FEA6_ZOAVI